MVSLILTTLPFVLTFATAAWHSPTKEGQPRSALPGHHTDISCPNCIS